MNNFSHIEQHIIVKVIEIFFNCWDENRTSSFPSCRVAKSKESDKYRISASGVKGVDFEFLNSDEVAYLINNLDSDKTTQKIKDLYQRVG